MLLSNGNFRFETGNRTRESEPRVVNAFEQSAQYILYIFLNWWNFFVVPI